jgi:DNA polymerase-3 subunit epsilon
MRQIVLDTETTGLNARGGDRIIEIGCVELVNRRPSGRTFHHYVNPERSSEPEALKVHGISDEFLTDKPKFAAIAEELMRFVHDAEIIIHNATFDVGFLDEELARLKRPKFTQGCRNVVDTLDMSKRLNPGKRHNLDALCERYGVSNAHRTLHGALLDAELLAEVFLAMTRGQDTLVMDLGGNSTEVSEKLDVTGLVLPVIAPSEDEMQAHERVLQSIEKAAKRSAIWRTL